MIKPIITEENIDPTEWDNQLAYLKDKTGLSINNCINYKGNSGLMQILRDSSTAINIILIDTEVEIVEGDKYLYKETFLDGTVKTQEQFDNANWTIDTCKKGDVPYIERARNGKNAQNGLLAVFKIISSTNKSHNANRREDDSSTFIPQLSPKSIQLLINYYNEHKCMPESVEVEMEKYHGWNRTIAEVAAVSAENNGEDYQAEFSKVLEEQGGEEYRMLINPQGEVDITIPEVEEKLYTEEELLLIIRRFKNHAEIHSWPSKSFKEKVTKLLNFKKK